MKEEYKSLSDADLQRLELELKVSEANIKVTEMELPAYHKLNTWTSLLAILIAVGSFAAQNIISHNQEILHKIQLANEVAAAKGQLDSAHTNLANEERKFDTAKARNIAANLEYDSLIKQVANVHGRLVSIENSGNSKVNTAQKQELRSLISQTQHIIAPRIYIQIPDAAHMAVAQHVSDQLKTEGYVIMGIDDVSGKAISPAKCEVRYYRDEEFDEAKTIVEQMRKANAKLIINGTPVKVKNGNPRPRHYEIWFSAL